MSLFKKSISAVFYFANYHFSCGTGHEWRVCRELLSIGSEHRNVNHRVVFIELGNTLQLASEKYSVVTEKDSLVYMVFSKLFADTDQM